LNVSLPSHPITIRRLFATVALLALSVEVAGCSMAIPLPAFVSKDDVTGSIRHFSSPLSAQVNLDDWRRAVVALSQALDPKGAGESVAWDNPKSGLNGSFTPVGEAYRRDDRLCRAFLGEIGADEKVRGTGCLDKRGEWAVLDVKPLKRG
jgi:surface antigen